MEHLEDRALRVVLHIFGHLRGGETQRLKGGGLILGHGRPFYERRRKLPEGRRRDLGGRARRKEGRAKGRNLCFRKATAHGHSADALDNFTERRSRRVHIVREMVDGIGQGVDLRQGQIHARPPVSHHLASLIAGQIEGHAHLCGLLGELRQILLGDARLPRSRDDGGDAARRHRYPPGHLHDLLGHGLKLGLRIEVHDLGDIGHRTLELDRGS